METVSLKGEPAFLRIVDRDEVFYGGDQAWFDSTVGKCSGCGTVAAADITAYLAGQREELRRLCPVSKRGSVMKKEDFLTHMCEVYAWVKPWKVPFVSEKHSPFKNFGWGLGVWPPSRFACGVKRFARSRGVRLKARRISSRRTMKELTDFVSGSLERDCPVAMLIGTKPKYELEPVERPDGFKWTQTHFSLHWVVITMLTKREGKVIVKVSTWGGYSWLDLEAWHHAGGMMPGLVSFEWMNEV